MRASRILLAFAFLAVGRTGNGLFLRMPYQLRHVALALCLVCLEPLVNGRSLMFTMDIPYVSFFFVSGCAGAFFLLAVCSAVKSRALILIGRNSLILVGTHYIIRNLIVMRPGYSAPISWAMFFAYLLGVAALSAVCISVYPVLFPHMIGKKLLYDPRKDKNSSASS